MVGKHCDYRTTGNEIKKRSSDAEKCASRLSLPEIAKAIGERWPWGERSRLNDSFRFPGWLAECSFFVVNWFSSMAYQTTIRGEHFHFADLREVFARANEE